MDKGCALNQARNSVYKQVSLHQSKYVAQTEEATKPSSFDRAGGDNIDSLVPAGMQAAYYLPASCRDGTAV